MTNSISHANSLWSTLEHLIGYQGRHKDLQACTTAGQEAIAEMIKCLKQENYGKAQEAKNDGVIQLRSAKHWAENSEYSVTTGTIQTVLSGLQSIEIPQ